MHYKQRVISFAKVAETNVAHLYRVKVICLSRNKCKTSLTSLNNIPQQWSLHEPIVLYAVANASSTVMLAGQSDSLQQVWNQKTVFMQSERLWKVPSAAALSLSPGSLSPVWHFSTLHTPLIYKRCRGNTTFSQVTQKSDHISFKRCEFSLLWWMKTLPIENTTTGPQRRGDGFFS